MPQRTYDVTAPNGKTLSITGDHMPTEAELQEIFASVGGASAPEPKPKSALERVADWMPTVGGAVGGAAGGIPGAALGGSAGRGYGEVVKNAKELPGAVADVARNAVAQPRATAQGAFEGTMESLRPTATEGALQAMTELAGRGATSLLSQGGRAVYRGYLKPSLSGRLLPKAKEIVETGIREAIPVTEGGAARLDKLRADLGGEVDRILSNATGDVDLHDVADQVRQFAQKEYYRPGQATADYEAAIKVADSIDKHPSIGLPPGAQPTSVRVSPMAANDLKRGMQARVAESYGVEAGAKVEAQKTGARGLRTGIEAVAPTVGPVNQRLGRLTELSDAIDRAVGREGNRNQFMGVPSILAGGAGATEALRTNPIAGAALAAATRAGLTPAAATRAAIYAAKLGDATPGTAAADVIRTAIQLVRSETNQQAGQ